MHQLTSKTFRKSRIQPKLVFRGLMVSRMVDHPSSTTQFTMLAMIKWSAPESLRSNSLLLALKTSQLAKATNSRLRLAPRSAWVSTRKKSRSFQLQLQATSPLFKQLLSIKEASLRVLLFNGMHPLMAVWLYNRTRCWSSKTTTYLLKIRLIVMQAANPSWITDNALSPSPSWLLHHTA